MAEYGVIAGINPKMMYNRCYVDLTQSHPALCAHVKLSLLWTKTETGQEVRRIDIYPYDWTKIGSYTVSESDINTPSDKLFTTLQTAIGDKYNFFKQLNIIKAADSLANSVSIVLFDPTGKIIEDQLIQTFIQSLGCAGLSVNILLEYGWEHGEENPQAHEWGNDLVDSGHGFMLNDVSINAEYTGATYTLTFIDAGMLEINTKPTSWMTDTFAQQSEGELWTLPQVTTAFWRRMIAAKRDKKGQTNIYLMRGTSPEMHSLTEKDWTGTDWDSTKKAPNAWAVKQNFYDFVSTNYAQTVRTSDKKKFVLSSLSSGRKISGNISNYTIYQPSNPSGNPTVSSFGTEWSPAASVLKAKTEKDCWYIPSNAQIFMLVEDKSATIAKTIADLKNGSDTEKIDAETSLAAIQAELKVGKKYLWLASNRDVRGTVIGITFDTNSFYAHFASRGAPASLPITTSPGENTPPTDKKPGGNPQENTQTFKVDPCALLEKGGAQSAKDASIYKKVESNTPKNPTDALFVQEATSAFVGILSATIEVIGDPELELCLLQGIQIDFDQSAQALLPWLKGTYQVFQLEDRIVDGMWTTTLTITKMGGLDRKDIEANRTASDANNYTDSVPSRDPDSPLTPVTVVGSISESVLTNVNEISKIFNDLANLGANILDSIGVPVQFITSLFDALSGLDNSIKDSVKNAMGAAQVTPEMAAAAGYTTSEVATDKSKNLSAGVQWFNKCYNQGEWAGDNINQRTMCATMAYQFGVKPVIEARKSAQVAGKLTDRNYELLHPFILDEIQKPQYANLGANRRADAESFINAVYTENYLKKYKGEPICITNSPELTGPPIVTEGELTTSLPSNTPLPPKIQGIINTLTVIINKNKKENLTPILYIKRNKVGTNFETCPGTPLQDKNEKFWTWTGISPDLKNGDQLKCKIRNLLVTPYVDSGFSSVFTVSLDKILTEEIFKGGA